MTQHPQSPGGAEVGGTSAWWWGMEVCLRDLKEIREKNVSEEGRGIPGPQ